MPTYYMTISRTLVESACLEVRAKDEEAANDKVQHRIDAGVPWDKLTEKIDTQEDENSISIDEVVEA
jgi:hypothetical protein